MFTKLQREIDIFTSCMLIFKWCLMVNVNDLEEVLSLLGKGDEFWESTILHILVDGEHWPRDP